MNRIMGTSCSVQRGSSSKVLGGKKNKSTGLEQATSGCATSSSLRYSIVSELTDQDVAKFYENSDSSTSHPYTTSPTLRSENSSSTVKSLSELATIAVCKSLVDNNNNDIDSIILPPGLPPDVVQDLLKSLYQQYALNSTTLRAIISNNSDLIQGLSLARCRGVNDTWFTIETNDHHNHFSSTLHDEQQNIDSSDSFDTAVMMMDTQHTDDTRHAKISPSVFDVDMHQDSSSPTNECLYMNIDPNDSDDSDSFLAGNIDTPMASPTLAAKSIVVDPTNSNNMSDANTTLSDIVMTPASLPSFSSSASFSLFSPVLQFEESLRVLDLSGCQDITDHGLLQLGYLDSLEEAHFDGCHALCGTGLRVVSTAKHLHTLTLKDCRRLTDDALYNLRCSNHSLEQLSLNGCRCITDNGLWAIRGLHEMKVLDLSCCDLITDQGVQYLEGMSKLQHVVLSWCKRITNAGFAEFSNQPGRSEVLTNLELVSTSVSDKGIGHLIPPLQALLELNLSNCKNLSSKCLMQSLKLLPNLQSLNLYRCSGIFKEPSYEAIKNLRELNLGFTGAKDSQFSSIASLPNLESLNLESCLVTDRVMSHFAENDVVPNLRHLDVADTDISDAGLVHIAKLQSITSLSLFYCPITNNGMKSIVKLPNLQKLNIDSRDVCDEGLRILRTCRTLTSLDVFSGRISDTGCRHISRLSNLEHLELCGGGVGDLGCVHLMRLKKLRTLNLAQNERITNRGALSLTAIPSLVSLNLSYTGVRGGAISKSLSKLPNLECLALCGCEEVHRNREEFEKAAKTVPSLRYLRLHNAPADEGIMNNKEIVYSTRSQASLLSIQNASSTSRNNSVSNKVRTADASYSSRSSAAEDNEEDAYSDYD